MGGGGCWVAGLCLKVKLHEVTPFVSCETPVFLIKHLVLQLATPPTSGGPTIFSFFISNIVENGFLIGLDVVLTYLPDQLSLANKVLRYVRSAIEP